MLFFIFLFTLFLFFLLNFFTITLITTLTLSFFPFYLSYPFPKFKAALHPCKYFLVSGPAPMAVPIYMFRKKLYVYSSLARELIDRFIKKSIYEGSIVLLIIYILYLVHKISNICSECQEASCNNLKKKHRIQRFFFHQVFCKLILKLQKSNIAQLLVAS